jgi:hypothetical protein
LAESFCDTIILFLRNYYRHVSVAAAALVIGIAIGYQFFTIRAYRNITSPASIAESAALPAAADTLSNTGNAPAEVGQPDKSETSVSRSQKTIMKTASYEHSRPSAVAENALFTAGANAGDKLRTLGGILEKSMSSRQLDPKIQNALISTLRTDNNPGVRRAALNSLLQVRYNAKIKDALINVLNNDKNAGLRVAAINALIDKEKEGQMDKKLYNALHNKTVNENNEYIRMRAKSALKEVSL